MKIIVASDSYKGCLSSKEVSTIVSDAISNVDSTITVGKVVVSDGGEGFVEAMVDATGGLLIQHETVDSLLVPKTSYYGVVNGDTVVIEVANVIGLITKKGYKLQPAKGSSFGVGLLIKEAINKGYRKIIIGLGGSCTNDGGMGILSALGVVFYDKSNRRLSAKADNMIRITKIDYSNMIELDDIEVTVACDVNNYLLGDQGATYTFGPQKGISEELLPKFEKGMANYCERVNETFDVDLNSYVGGGAAGGIGSVLFALLNAKMELGIELLLKTVNFPAMLTDCDLVITGEGKTDDQTLQGKAVYGVSKIAKKCNVPVICISGSLQEGYQELYKQGVVGFYSVLKGPATLVEAINNAKENLYDTTYSLIKSINCFYSKGE